MITALTAMPAPSGGAVRLLLHTTTQHASALILATTVPEAPDPYADIEARPEHAPQIVMPVRLVHSGVLRQEYRYPVKYARHVYLVMDLDSDALPDGTEVHYHVYNEVDGHYGPPLSASVTPRCARSTAATLARELVMSRLRYHLARAVADQTIPYEHVPVLEQLVREEGSDIPAILVKETATPNPSAETVGHHLGETTHPDGTKTVSQRFAYRARVDILALTDNATDRRTFEKLLRGIFPADLDFYQQGGIEEPQFSFFPNHDIQPDGTDEYTVEVTFEGTVYTRVFEERTPLRDTTVRR